VQGKGHHDILGKLGAGRRFRRTPGTCSEGHREHAAVFEWIPGVLTAKRLPGKQSFGRSLDRFNLPASSRPPHAWDWYTMNRHDPIEQKNLSQWATPHGLVGSREFEGGIRGTGNRFRGKSTCSGVEVTQLQTRSAFHCWLNSNSSRWIRRSDLFFRCHARSAITTGGFWHWLPDFEEGSMSAELACWRLRYRAVCGDGQGTPFVAMSGRSSKTQQRWQETCSAIIRMIG